MGRFTASYVQKIILYTCISITCMMLHSCALQIAPTGGPKDLTSPKVLKSLPENGTLNFKDSKILITFDEFIELNDAQKEIVITPPLEHPATYTLKKHTLIIDFKENKLKENTTYTILLGNSIKDLHEGNKLGGYNYVFSTGTYLDSFSVDGRVVDALTHKEGAGAKVLLYSKNNDSSVYKHKPDYYAVTDKGGVFHVEHLRKDTFTIYALIDKNDNLLYDDGEDIGFLKQRVVTHYQGKPDTSKTKVDTTVKKIPVDQTVVWLFNTPREKYRLKAYTFNPPALGLTFRKVPENISITAHVNHKDFPVLWKEFKAKDSIQAWIPAFGDTPLVNKGFHSFRENVWLPSHLDTNSILLTIKLDTVKIDTVLKSKAKVAKDAFKLTTKVENTSYVVNKYSYPLIVTFNIPVTKVDKDKILILPPGAKNSTLTSYKFADSAHTQLLMDASLDPDTVTKIKILPGAFTSIYGTINDTIKSNIIALQSRNFGHFSMILHLPTEGDSYILQLVDKDYKVYYEKVLLSSQKIDLPYMDPGTYKLRVIRDANHNKRWDSGNFALKILPEDIYYYPDDIIVKANWDILDVQVPVKF